MGLRDYGSEQFFLRFYGIFDSQLRDCGFIQYDGTRYFSIFSRCVGKMSNFVRYFGEGTFLTMLVREGILRQFQCGFR